MSPKPPMAPTEVKPWARMLILLSAMVAICLLSLRLTGSLIPSKPGDVLVFQNALLLVVLGSTVLEYKFTAPADAVVNSLAGVLTLVSVYSTAPTAAWWWAFGYCAAVFVLATACTAVSSGATLSGWRRALADFTYPPAVVFGRARVLFSVLFLFGLVAFYGIRATATAELVVFWGVYIAIWPLGLPALLSKVTLIPSATAPIGRVIRTDSPNLVRVALLPRASWRASSVKVYQRADGVQENVVPLYSQVQQDQLVGTGLCFSAGDARVDGLLAGHVYDSRAQIDSSVIAESLGGGPGSRFVGFVVEESTIAEIRFEVCDATLCREGMLVSCRVGGKQAFYQLTNGVTREESLEADRHGYQVASAAQLGFFVSSRGFEKCPWLPPMNTPVFAEADTFGTGAPAPPAGDFRYGVLPGTNLAVTGPFCDEMEFHTAILGVTGSGKTELALDLIKHAVSRGIKVVCIDLTARYHGRLGELSPHALSLTPELSTELGQKLFAVETGQYGAGNEKKALKELADRLRTDIDDRLAAFLRASEADHRLGIVTLEEISNTKATLYVTELFLTCLLHFAKDHPRECPRVLVVVEEAHTVMPEPTTMGLGDYDSRGLVSKIAQIALQGRKYGVGLLVIAQRTATVSKTVLTQCNTMISLSCFDDTSLGFLGNFFGTAHARLVPNLGRLQAVAFGKAVRSERPIIVEIPFDHAKTDAEARAAGKRDGNPVDTAATPVVTEPARPA